MPKVNKAKGLQKIISDERTGPNRRLLAEMLTMYFKASGAEKMLLENLLLGTFGPNAKRIRWADPDDERDAPTVTDQKHTDELRKMLSSALTKNPGGDDAS